MTPQILASLFRSVATIASDPALGYRGSSVVAVLNLIAVAVEAGVEGLEELKKLQLQVNEMVDNAREPTKAEWAELRARSNVAHDILNPPPPPDPEPGEVVA